MSLKSIETHKNRFICQLAFLSRVWFTSEILLPGLILAAAIWMRITHLGQASLWHDEAHTWWIATQQLPDFLDALRAIGVHPPLYFLMAKASIFLLGESEHGLRFLSACLDVFAIILVMKIGREIGEFPGQLAAGWFWSFHPMATWFAREARPYAMAAALTVGLIWIAMTLHRRGDLRMWVSVFLVLALGLLVHYYFFLVFGVQILVALADLKKRPVFFRRWVVISLMALLPLAGWLYWYFRQATPSLGIGWIQRPALSDIAGTLWNLFSGYGGELTPAAVVFGLLSVFLAMIAISTGRKNRFVHLTLWLGLLLPVSLVWLVSQKRPVYVDRYFIVLLPYAAILVSSGARVVWQNINRWLNVKFVPLVGYGTVIVLGIIGFLAGWQVHVDDLYAREDWRGLASYLDQKTDGSPFVWLLDSESLVPFQYYYRSDFQLIATEQQPIRESTCWWVMRQPYTATHAFTQAVTLPGDAWKPALPKGCLRIDDWESPSGLALWMVLCTGMD